MEKALKTKLTKEKILNAAIVEFGSKTYEEASLNAMCSSNNISKGLIYHNFKDKDEIYILVVKRVYDELIAYFNSLEEDDRDDFASFFKKREEFFANNHYHQNIFFETIFNPPVHLEKSIREVRKPFEDYLKGRYIKIIDDIKLKEGISKQEAVDYISFFCDAYNAYFRHMYRRDKFDELVNAHENKMNKMLDYILHGIAVERN